MSNRHRGSVTQTPKPKENPKLTQRGGNGAPRFKSEIRDQINTAEKCIEKLKARFPFTDANRSEIKTLRGKVNTWTRELLDL